MNASIAYGINLISGLEAPSNSFELPQLKTVSLLMDDVKNVAANS